MSKHTDIAVCLACGHEVKIKCKKLSLWSGIKRFYRFCEEEYIFCTMNIMFCLLLLAISITAFIHRNFWIGIFSLIPIISILSATFVSEKYQFDKYLGNIK